MAEFSRQQIIRHMGHLVQKRVDALRAIAGKEEIDVERDLHHESAPVPMAARHHVSERRPHAIAQPERYVVGEQSVEARLVEVAVERMEILSLSLTAATALRHGATTSWARLTHLFEGAGKLGPIQHGGTGLPGCYRRYSARTNNDRERIEDVRRCAAECDVHVQRGSFLRQRPYRGPIIAECDTLEPRGTTTPQSGSETVGRVQLFHTSRNESANAEQGHKIS